MCANGASSLKSWPCVLTIVASVVTGWVVGAPNDSDFLRVMSLGVIPEDRRLEPLQHLNGYFPFVVPETPQLWKARRAALKRRILVASGLWPMPRKTELNAVIHGRVERPGFTVEKVYFESYPGHFVTGLLFRPEGRTGRLPAVLSPHGHGGRLLDISARIRQEIVSGAERFEASGSFPKLARCAQLARMGCVTFIYDMVGYADSVQISRAVSHQQRDPRPELDTPSRWGFFSTQAELRLQSIFGLQTYNTIRALDFLCSLPDVDPERVAVTGGSGGGTQTIILGAMDSRPIVSFPQGMVSTSMQGGCLCENASLLRVNAGNVEIAAMFGPKPMAMTAADDWTRDMMTKGYPELQRLYDMLGMKDNVFCKSLVHFPHNYNYVTRAVMYSWFNRHMNLGLQEPIVEEDFARLTPQEYTVWNDEHPAPAGGPTYEASLTKWIHNESERQLAELTPRDKRSLADFRSVVGGAFEVILGDAPASGDVKWASMSRASSESYSVLRFFVRVGASGAEVPAVWLQPKEWNRKVAIWVDGAGKSGLLDDSGVLRTEVEELLAAGTRVIAADLLFQGEYLADGKPLAEARFNSTRRPYAGYTFGYNPSLFARRVHDVLALIWWARKGKVEPDRVDLLGVNGGGPWAAAARALAGAAVDRAAVDTGGFRFANIQRLAALRGQDRSCRDVNMLPGALKYGDVPALLALSAPGELWLGGEEGEVPPLTAAAYLAAGDRSAVQSSNAAASAVRAAAVAWLLEPEG